MFLSFLPLAAADVPSALAARDFTGCESLGTPDDALWATLVASTDPTLQPPSVPVRAASCLVSLFGESPKLEATVTPWMTDPSRAGLALVVAGELDRLPIEVAQRLAKAAKGMPDATARGRLLRRVGASTRPEIAALAAD